MFALKRYRSELMRKVHIKCCIKNIFLFLSSSFCLMDIMTQEETISSVQISQNRNSLNWKGQYSKQCSLTYYDLKAKCETRQRQ